MDAVILLGAPGSGKGTTASDLIRNSDFVHLSTGDLFRTALKEGQSIGLKARHYIERGELVPDELVLTAVQERMALGDPKARYLFDGYPRTRNQAVMLDTLMEQRGGRILNAFELAVDRNVLVVRISGRRICRQCSAVFHVTNIPPKVEGVCDRCGGELYQRSDDNEATVNNRLDVYDRLTRPLIDYYGDKGLLVRITDTRREDILREILSRLSSAS